MRGYCFICGEVTELEKHHAIPRSMGGTSDDGNMIGLCTACHRAVHAIRKSRVSTSKLSGIAVQHLKSNLRPYTLCVYGYNRKDDKLVKNSAEQKIIRQIQRQHKDGISLSAIARELNTAKVPTKRGATWYASTVRYILQNELYGAAA